MNNREKGKLGEDIAAEYLKKEGYEILQRNYRALGGEIDIIAYYRNIITFVEVKSRKSLRYGFPREAVNLKKQQTIKSVALDYIKNNSLWNYSIRFDVLEIIYGENYEKNKIVLLENSF